MNKISLLILTLFISVNTCYASTLAQRQYNWVDDKNNGIPITASRQDAELDNIITKLNQKVLIAASAPSSPIAGELWFDSTNKLLKQYRNSEWVVNGVVHVGTSAPATSQTGDLWYDSTNKILQSYNGASWVIYAVLGANTFTGTQTWAKGADVSSATTTTLGTDGNFFKVTGTTTITSITAKPAGTVVMILFSGALTLTNGSNLILSGNLVTVANTTIALVSDGTNWIELARSQTIQPYVKCSNTQTSGSNGGTATSGAWRTLTLNTKDTDTASIATLSSNQISLPAGTYKVLGFQSFYSTDTSQTRLQNITDTSTILIGQSVRFPVPAAVAGASIVMGEFTLSAAKTIEFQYQVSSTQANTGLGIPGSFGSEVYAQIEIWKLQ